jgi:hypothetical protein
LTKKKEQKLSAETNPNGLVKIIVEQVYSTISAETQAEYDSIIAMRDPILYADKEGDNNE